MTVKKRKVLEDPSSVASPPENQDDYTNSASAANRVLHINLLFFRYGTNDKTHGAAVILSIIILAMMMLVFTIGVWSNCETKEFLTWLGGAFLFIAGVAVGKGSNGKD